MPPSTASLGLTAAELQRLVHSLIGPSVGAYDEIEAVPPLVYQARRAALEATAALIAANNRRLTEQLGRLDVAATPPLQPAVPARLAAVYRDEARPGANKVHH